MASESSENSEPLFYQPLKPELSQGDIVVNVPWGNIPHPLTVCRPKNATKSNGVADYAPPDQVTKPPAFSGDRIEAVHASARRGACIVLWHDCQIDYLTNKEHKKADDIAKALVAVAPLKALNVLPAHLHDGLRNGLRPAAFYMRPHEQLAVAGLPGEAYVDFRFIWSVRQVAVAANRILSVSDVVRDALHDHMFWFLTALTGPDVLTCPHCGVEFAPLPPETDTQA